jgi:hypothetical protein
MAYEAHEWPDEYRVDIDMEKTGGWEKPESCSWDNEDVSLHVWSYRYDYPSVVMACDVCGSWVTFEARITGSRVS